MSILAKFTDNWHPNVVALIDFFNYDYDPFNSRLYTVIEFSPIGDLFHYITRGKEINFENLSWDTIPEYGAKHIIIGLTNALKHLFDHQIVHNDVKPDNILLFWTNGMVIGPKSIQLLSMTPKLCDFNNSEDWSKCKSDLFNC